MDDKLLVKIGNLLRQAEGTDNEHEAATFTEAAQRLATANAISLEVARARAADRDKPSTPTTRMVHIGERGKKGLRTYVQLFSEIARANDVRVDIAHNSTYVIAFGFADDIDVVEALYVSLVVQMVGACDTYLAAGEWRSHTVTRLERSRSFYGHTHMLPVEKPLTKLAARLQFQTAFAERIGRRLADARQEAIDAAIRGETTRPDASSSTELVMRDKEVAVNDFYTQTSTARGAWRGGRATAHSDHARRAGAAAGQCASLGDSTATLAGAGRELGR